MYYYKDKITTCKLHVHEFIDMSDTTVFFFKIIWGQFDRVVLRIFVSS